MRFEYRITKYDPRFRDAVGRYTRDEWTFFAQVGQRVAGRLVTMSEYLQTEASYLRTLSALLTEAGVARLDIRDLNIVPKQRWRVGGGEEQSPYH